MGQGPELATSGRILQANFVGIVGPDDVRLYRYLTTCYSGTPHVGAVDEY